MHKFKVILICLWLAISLGTAGIYFNNPFYYLIGFPIIIISSIPEK
jgi:hypothetical protein